MPEAGRNRRPAGRGAGRFEQAATPFRGAARRIGAARQADLYYGRPTGAPVPPGMSGRPPHPARGTRGRRSPGMSGRPGRPFCVL